MTTLTLEPLAGPWPDDDPHANFKQEVATVGLADPLQTFTALSAETGIPVGALVRYVMAKWAAEGSEALLAVGPRVVQRLAGYAADVRVATDDAARDAALDRLLGLVDWLALPLAAADAGATPDGAPVGVRAATLADAAAIAALVRDALGYDVADAVVGERLAATLAEHGRCVLVAERDGRVSAFAAARLGASLSDGVACTLTNLAVAPAQQGAGVGSTLLDAVETWARSRGAAKLVLTSATHRDAAHAFYEHRGYARTGVRLTKRL